MQHDATTSPNEMQHDDKTGAIDINELAELNDFSVAGGAVTPTTSSWTCVTFATVSICPTSACSDRCPNRQ